MLQMESVSLSLGRDIGDKASTEAIDVRMENIQTMGNLNFKVYYDEETMFLCGDLERIEKGSDH